MASPQHIAVEQTNKYSSDSFHRDQTKFYAGLWVINEVLFYLGLTQAVKRINIKHITSEVI